MERLLEATFRVEARHFWFVGLRAFVRNLIAAAALEPSGARILDCGCGTGANMAVLAEFGAPVGIDLSWFGLHHARGRGDHPLVQANVARLPFHDECFDLAVALDVLSTLPEPDEAAALTEIARVLRPGAALVLNVAALRALRGNHSVFGKEIRRYTRSELRRRLQRAGFLIERLTYTNFSLFPLILIVRRLQRLAGRPSPEETGTDLVVPSPPVNALLSGLLSLEARALCMTDMPVGSSLLCLARKPR